MLDELNYQEQSETQKEESRFNISIEQLKICLQEGIDMNNLYLLEAFNEGSDLTKHIESPKLLSWKQTLIRKALIDEQGFITIKGKDTLERINKAIDKKSIKLPKNIVPGEETPFEKWWKAFPATDNFDFGNRTFKGSRTFKKEKQECMIMFNRIINNGRITAEEMIGAIETEVLRRKEESLSTGQNKLTFLKNTASYLRQENYEAWVEVYRNNKEKDDTGSSPGYHGTYI